MNIIHYPYSRSQFLIDVHLVTHNCIDLVHIAPNELVTFCLSKGSFDR